MNTRQAKKILSRVEERRHTDAQIERARVVYRNACHRGWCAGEAGKQGRHKWEVKPTPKWAPRMGRRAKQ